MNERIDLRPAASQDFEFAFRVYKETMEEYSSAYIVWDDDRQKASLTDQLRTAETSIITLDRANIGWLAILETDSTLILGHFYIEPRFQRQGVGSAILRRLLATAVAQGKTVQLTVLKNNPAKRLYERFGFEVVDEDEKKFSMRRTHGV